MGVCNTWTLCRTNNCKEGCEEPSFESYSLCCLGSFWGSTTPAVGCSRRLQTLSQWLLWSLLSISIKEHRVFPVLLGGFIRSSCQEMWVSTGAERCVLLVLLLVVLYWSFHVWQTSESCGTLYKLGLIKHTLGSVLGLLCGVPLNVTKLWKGFHPHGREFSPQYVNEFILGEFLRANVFSYVWAASVVSVLPMLV